MIIKKLILINFKNHSERDFQLSPHINCFVGNNGVGKTNVLDALHYLSMGKSFLGLSDHQNIKNNKEFFSITSNIINNDREDTIKISLNKDAKKIIKKNDKPYPKIAEHIGYLPNVIISPYDSNLISDSGDSRRKFIDAMISQTDAEYLFSLIQYQKAIQQRNALLKLFAKNKTFDRDSLDIYSQPIITHGTRIFQKRKTFVTDLKPIVQHFYDIISGGKELININYESHLSERDFGSLLEESLDKDRILTYTSKGIHKDDLSFEMNQNLIKKIGSQGQQKSFLIALKLAQINRIKELTNKTPILILDDIFDKLDDSRVAQLIELVNTEQIGQILITHNQKETTENVVNKKNNESKIFEI